MGTEGLGTRVGLYNEQGKMVGYADKDDFATGGSSVTYQDDTRIVKFDKNYQKFYVNTPFVKTTEFDEETETTVLISLEIDLTNAKLGNSVQLYATGELPFQESVLVNFQNLFAYKPNVVNLIVLDYKSDTDITAVIINNEPIDLNLENVAYVPKDLFLNVLSFDKNYEIGSYDERVKTFTIDSADYVQGTNVKVFYNDVALPTEDIKWVDNCNTLKFVTNEDCLLTLYKTSTGEVIGNIFKV